LSPKPSRTFWPINRIRDWDRGGFLFYVRSRAVFAEANTAGCPYSKWNVSDQNLMAVHTSQIKHVGLTWQHSSFVLTLGRKE
jgi:hypothetical protein